MLTKTDKDKANIHYQNFSQVYSKLKTHLTVKQLMIFCMAELDVSKEKVKRDDLNISKSLGPYGIQHPRIFHNLHTNHYCILECNKVNDDTK